VRKTHPLYKKQYTVNTKFMAHDEKNEAKVGDKVAVVECRPLSARKRFTLSKVLEHANVGFDEKDATADVAEEETSEEKK
jgi:small subunit ribosomal protein S17